MQDGPHPVRVNVKTSNTKNNEQPDFIRTNSLF